MQVALHQRDHDYVLALGQRLRSAGVFNPGAIELELFVLDQVSPTRALAVINEGLETTTDGAFARYLRMRRTHLGLRMHRPDLIERSTSKLPTLDEISESMAVAAVLAIREADVNAALATAYALFRRLPDSVQSHQAMIRVVLGNGRSAPIEIESPMSVCAGTAVLLKDTQNDNRSWHVLEDLPDPRPSLNEVSPDSPLAKAVVGKLVGDLAEIPEAFGTNRTVRIEAVLHKWIYRFQRCLKELPTRFPEQQFIKPFTVKAEAGSPEQEFAPLLQFLERVHGEHADAAVAYRENPFVPLHLLARGLGLPLPFALSHFVSEGKGVIRCCAGTATEAESARTAIQSARKIVIDPTVVATAFLLLSRSGLFLFENMKDWPVERLIAEEALYELRAVREEVRRGNARLGVQRHDGTLSPQVLSEADAAELGTRILPKLDRVLESLEKNCAIVSGSTLTKLPAEHREDFVSAMGRSGAESLNAALESGALLWTDDAVCAHFASQLGGQRVWTQSVAQWLIFEGDADHYRRVSLDLLSLAYDFTALTTADVLAAGHESMWRVTNQPLRAALDCFARPSIGAEWIITTCATCLASVWGNSVLGFQATQVTQRILDRVGKRPDGRSIVSALRLNLDAIFGLHVVAAENVRNIIDNWTKVNGEGGIIIP